MKFNKGDIAILPHRDGARLFKVFSHGMTGRGQQHFPVWMPDDEDDGGENNPALVIY